MLPLPERHLRLAGDHAGNQRHLARIVEQPEVLALGRSQAGGNNQLNHASLLPQVVKEACRSAPPA
jgi:hypothetical protein